MTDSETLSAILSHLEYMNNVDAFVYSFLRVFFLGAIWLVWKRLTSAVDDGDN